MSSSILKKREVIITRQLILRKQIDAYYNPGYFYTFIVLQHPSIAAF